MVDRGDGFTVWYESGGATVAATLQVAQKAKPGDVLLQPFSPTGFYSSAVRNDFLRDLEAD